MDSCWATLVAQRQAALNSVSFGSLPHGHADTAEDTMMGKQSNTKANPTTSALLLPILHWIISPLQKKYMISCILCQKLNPFLAIGGESELHLVSDQWSMPTDNMNLVVRPCPFDVCVCLRKKFLKNTFAPFWHSFLILVGWSWTCVVEAVLKLQNQNF